MIFSQNPAPNRRFIVLQMVLALFLCPHLVLAGECRHVFGPEVRAIHLQINSQGNQIMVDGVETRRIQNDGRMNWFILSIVQNGVPAIYKIMGKSHVTWNQIVQGIRLGEAFGGPKLLAHGPIIYGRDMRDRGAGYYTKLEHLFPGKTVYNVKTHGFVKSEISTEKMLKEIAQSLVRMGKEGIIPSDPDFIYTREGLWRWIDTDLWHRGDLLDKQGFAYQAGQLLSKMDLQDAIQLARFVMTEAHLLSPEIQNSLQSSLSYYLSLPNG